MSGEGPKLFTHKPKKSKLKASTAVTVAPASSTVAAAAQPSRTPPLPPPPKKESFVRRYRFLWPLLLGVNFTVGAYVLMRIMTKSTDTPEEEKLPEGPTNSTPTSTTAPATKITENPITQSIIETPISPPVIVPVVRTPIPEDQQRALFKWMLEEKRKVKPRDAEEKKRIDEEKEVLKQFIRAKPIPIV